MNLLSRLAAIGVAALLGACAAQPAAKGPPETLIAANTADERPGIAAKLPSRVIAGDTQVAQTLALWRAVSRGAVGQEIEWASSASADHGTAIVLRDVPLPKSDRICREYRQDSVIDGRARRSLGQVCQQRDGGWVVLGGIAAAPMRAIAIGSPCLETPQRHDIPSQSDPVCRG
jgi:surface antigen